MVVPATEGFLVSLPCMVNHACNEHGAQNEASKSGILLFSRKNPRLCYTLSVYTPSNAQDEGYVAFGSDAIGAKVLLNVNFSVITLEAQPVVAWQSSEIVSCLRRVFQPQHQWVLSHESGKETGVKASDDAERLSWYILYRMDMRTLANESWNDLIQYAAPLRSEFGLRLGGMITTRSYPFGPDVMEIFADTQSSGIVSNMSTSGGTSLFLTDARCLPGSEGGGVYSYNAQSSSQEMVGMIISPLCWKSQELLGLTICCSLREVVASLTNVLRCRTQLHDVHFEMEKLLRATSSGNVAGCFPRYSGPTVVRVMAGGIWGSGVVVAVKAIIDSCTVIIVTCMHVVEKAVDSSAYISFDTSRKRHRARIVFCTDDKSAYDLAILEFNIGKNTIGTLLPNEARNMTELGKDRYIVPHSFHSSKVRKGEPALVKGYALFDKESGLGPSISRGVLSNIVHYDGEPVLLHSTCLVHKGSSGGGLICGRSGNLAGIVVNHVKDEDVKISYPDVNFSIPCDVFMPVVEQYLVSDGCDNSVFSRLNCHDKEVIRMWNVEPKQKAEGPEEIRSKL